jgi:hypothetical protein
LRNQGGLPFQPETGFLGLLGGRRAKITARRWLRFPQDKKEAGKT